MGSSRYSASSWEMWSHGSLRAVYDWEAFQDPVPPGSWNVTIDVTPHDKSDVIEVLDAPPGSRNFGLLDLLQIYVRPDRIPLVRAFGRPVGSKAPWGSRHSHREFRCLDATSLNDIASFIDPVDVAIGTPLGDYTVVVTGGVIVTGLREQRDLIRNEAQESTT